MMPDTRLVTPEAAVVLLQSIDPADPEAAHGTADEVLLACVPVEVRRAYTQLVENCPWWASA